MKIILTKNQLKKLMMILKINSITCLENSICSNLKNSRMNPNLNSNVNRTIILQRIQFSLHSLSILKELKAGIS